MRIFLDANVIADWILLKNKDLKNITSDILIERYRQFGYSYNLVERTIRSGKKIAFTSELALAEVFGVIYDDAINMKLFAKAVPAASWYWVSIRKKSLLRRTKLMRYIWVQWRGLMNYFQKLNWLKILST